MASNNLRLSATPKTTGTPVRGRARSKSPKSPRALASRLLKSCLDRLEGDWQQAYGHQVLVAESVSAYEVQTRCWLGSEPVAEGSNEIPAARELLRRIHHPTAGFNLAAMRRAVISVAMDWIHRCTHPRDTTTTGFSAAMRAGQAKKPSRS